MKERKLLYILNQTHYCLNIAAQMPSQIVPCYFIINYSPPLFFFLNSAIFKLPKPDNGLTEKKTYGREIIEINNVTAQNCSIYHCPTLFNTNL